jgi:hypothetical protein
MRWAEAATTPGAISRLLAKHGLGPRPPLPSRSPPIPETTQLCVRALRTPKLKLVDTCGRRLAGRGLERGRRPLLY